MSNKQQEYLQLPMKKKPEASCTVAMSATATLWALPLALILLTFILLGIKPRHINKTIKSQTLAL